MLGRQIGLSDLELLELTKDGGLLYHPDVSRNSHEFLKINEYELWFYYGIGRVSIYKNGKWMNLIDSVDNENKLKLFTKFLNLIL